MKIGVVHPNLNLRGGAEYVNVEVIQAIREEHEVELITFEEPDIDGLNSFYDTDLDRSDFDIRKPLSGVFFSKFKGSLFKLRNHFIKRYAKKKRENYDLLISGMDEADFGEEGFQYIHFPESVNEQVFHEEDRVTTDLTDTDSGFLYSAYLYLVNTFFKENKQGVELNHTVCNSNFTKSVYQKVFSNGCKVINPPVSMSVEPKEFEKRGEAFVVVGNISESKGQKEVIEILDQVREIADLELHIVGSGSDTKYYNEVKEMSAEREWVCLEGKVSRDRLKELLASKKYGIHNFAGEHYGLAPAEMVKANCITFAPSRGGPKEIVGNNEKLIFQDKEEAVSKIKKVVSDEETQKELFNYISGLKVNSPEEFREKIREEIEECLE